MPNPWDEQYQKPGDTGGDMPWQQSYAKPTPVAPSEPTMMESIKSFPENHPYITAAASMIPGIGAPIGAVTDPTGEVGKGSLKQLGRDAYGIMTGPGAGPIGMGLGYLGDKTGISKRMQAATEPNNPQQEVGGWGVTAAESMLPIGRAIDALPNAARAGKTFERVMAKAGDTPIDISEPGKFALRAQELAGRGGSLPKVVSDFIGKTGIDVAPQGGMRPMLFREGRDFATNAGRLSAAENLATNKPMQSQVAQFSKALGGANSNAARIAGVGPEFESAMREYRNAMRLRNAGEMIKSAAKKAIIPLAVGGGIGATVARHFLGD